MVPGAKLYTVRLHDEVSDCFNWVGTRLFVNLDKKADLGVSENGDVHVTAKVFLLNGTKTAVWTHISHSRHDIIDMSPARFVHHTFMIDLAACL